MKQASIFHLQTKVSIRGIHDSCVNDEFHEFPVSRTHSYTLKTTEVVKTMFWKGKRKVIFLRNDVYLSQT